MSQVNVNTPDPEPVRDDRGGRAVAAGFNLITVLILAAVAIAIIALLYWLVTGSGLLGGGAVTPAATVVPQKTSEILAGWF